MAWDSDGLRDITQDAYRLAATGSLLANTGGGVAAGIQRVKPHSGFRAFTAS